MQLRSLIVPPAAAGVRADAFLARFLPEISEHTLREAFARRDVKLDGVRIPRETRLQPGQEIRIYFAEETDPLEIVYEDGDVLLVNKRPGLSVEPDEKGGATLTDLCLHHVRGENPSAPAPSAVHRLDNQTSGLCLFAKNEAALAVLLDVFRQRRIEKEYECLVRGVPKPPKAVCRAYLIKDARRARVEIAASPLPGSREIVTGYETLSAGPVSRLRVQLFTGRTHQIRAHLAALGHPLLGDDLYGDRAFNRLQKARTLRLCAVSLRLDTQGRLPALDQRTFTVPAPF